MTQDKLNELWLGIRKERGLPILDDENWDRYDLPEEEEAREAFDAKVQELGGACSEPMDNGMNNDSFWNVVNLLDKLGFDHFKDPTQMGIEECGQGWAIVAFPKEKEE